MMVDCIFVFCLQNSQLLYSGKTHETNTRTAVMKNNTMKNLPIINCVHFKVQYKDNID